MDITILSIFCPIVYMVDKILWTYDHDFTSLAEGIIIPHGIYDVLRNNGYLHLGTSKDTSKFACNCIRSWWNNHGREAYPDATAILGLCDGGGSNHSHHYIFKEDLQKLVDELGIEIRIAHYPPYCSKFNPVEHRLFPSCDPRLSGRNLYQCRIGQRIDQENQDQQRLEGRG